MVTFYMPSSQDYGQRDVKELGKGLKMETGELVGGFICAPG